MIALKEGERSYKEYVSRTVHIPCSKFDPFPIPEKEVSSATVIYKYEPITSRVGYIIRNDNVMWDDYLFVFDISRQVLSSPFFEDSTIEYKKVFLDQSEIKRMYADPKAIWDEAERWEK